LVKWVKRLLVILMIAWILLPGLSVLADTSADVTITATGVVVGAPTGFTVTYIDDHTVQLDWGMPAGADKIMIRAKYGDYPAEPVPIGTEPTDGYLLYYGNGITTQDTAVNLDEMYLPVYYRAWIKTAGGAWSPLYADGYVEGPGMAMMAEVLGNFLILLIAGALIWLAFWQRSNMLQILAGFVSVGFGIYWLTVDVTFLYVIEAIAIVAVGLYMMLMVGVDYIRGD
jgi:hypothetical protein